MSGSFIYPTYAFVPVSAQIHFSLPLESSPIYIQIASPALVVAWFFTFFPGDKIPIIAPAVEGLFLILRSTFTV